MAYYTVQIPHCADVRGLRRTVERLEVEPECSQHGTAWCLTWPDDAVPLDYVQGLAAHFSLFNRDVELYKDVVERPYRFQPQPLDHGTLVKVFNEGVRRGLLESEEEQLPLPEATAKVIRALQSEGGLPQRLEVTLTERDGQQVAEITAEMPALLTRSRSYADLLYEAVEGTSTEDFLVTLKLVPVDVQRGPILGVEM